MKESLSDFYAKHRTSNWFWVALIVLACSLLMLGFPLLGVPSGYDIAQHFRFAAAYRDSILQGQLIPSWAPVDNSGFGSVGIRFYPPLADYILAITSLVTNDWYYALQLNSFLWMFPGCIGIYFWIKDFRPKGHAAIAAILYAALPYHLIEIYQFQLYSEFVASAILPFCFFSVSKLVNRGETKDILGLAVSCSLLFLTHIPSSLIGFLGLAVYTCFLLDWNKWKSVAVKLFISAALTLLMTAFYLVRLVSEVNWVKHSTSQYSTGFYDPQRHLFPLVFSFGETYWQKLWWVLDIAIVFTIILSIPLVICLISKKARTAIRENEWKQIVAVAVSSIFSLLILSKPVSAIWSAAPVLEKIQFPWRFLCLSSIFAAVSLTLAAPILFKFISNYKRLALYSVAAVLFALLVFDVTQIIISAAPLQEEAFNESVVDKRQEESCQCWWPVWANALALKLKDRVALNSREVAISEWNPEDRSFTVKSGTPGFARIATFYYPRWRAEVNGVPVEVGRDENGAIVIPISQQESTVRVWFQEPPMFTAAAVVSMLTWLCLFSTIAFSLLMRLRQRKGGHSRQEAFAT